MSFRSFNFSSSRIGRSRFRESWYSFGRTRPTMLEFDSRFRSRWRDDLGEREITTRQVESVGQDVTVDKERVDERSEITGADLTSKLHVTNLDLNIAENTKKHHTDMYECTEVRGHKEAELVVRRGQSFLITITFDRPYDIDKNDITLLFNLACSENDSTVEELFKVTEDGDTSYKPRRWGATVVKKGGNSLTVEVFSPASTPVGVWDLIVRTTVDVENGKDLIWQYNHNEDINIIFNPWCKEDVVYLPDQEWLAEAVENDSGMVYQGDYFNINAKPWYFGQFEDGILHASLHLLRKGFNFKMTRAMGNAPKVARALSKIVNFNDDNGVLYGKWRGGYDGGTPPNTWTGSVKILKQYMSTAKPVRFGQCWVFSGVLVTVCRALGLPCRSVTNYESSHNTDKERLSFDEIYRPNHTGGYVNVSGDRKWNFHVWNEVWMSRPDLGKQFDGWQAIDATPQEESEGVFCCGPAPVKAIKEGLIYIGHDTPFVFAEVNADFVTWEEDVMAKKLKQVARTRNIIGKNISTHSPSQEPQDELQRLDVTDQYKYPQGSTKAREVLRQAQAMFRKDNLADDEDELPMSQAIGLSMDNIDVMVGKGFSVKIHTRNNDNVARTVTLSIDILHKTYHGMMTGMAAQSEQTETLQAGQSQTFTLSVTQQQAMMRPQEGFNFQIQVFAKVKETGSLFTQHYNVQLRRPDLVIKGPSTVKSGDTVEVDLSFTNPLIVPMTKCEVEIEGNMKTVPPLMDKITIGSISPGQTWRKTIKMCPTFFPRTKKKREASFGLESDQLGDVRGSYSVQLT